MPMTTVSEHYENLLAPTYSWMAGGVKNAFTQGALALESWMPSGAVAVDLGSGFGVHTIPLARAGWKVLAIDPSQHLANKLRGHAQGLVVRTVVADLVDFSQHLAPEAQADFILCMGDTLAHLPGWDDLDRLARRVARSLSGTGRFMATKPGRWILSALSKFCLGLPGSCLHPERPLCGRTCSPARVRSSSAQACSQVCAGSWSDQALSFHGHSECIGSGPLRESGLASRYRFPRLSLPGVRSRSLGWIQITNQLTAHDEESSDGAHLP